MGWKEDYLKGGTISTDLAVADKFLIADTSLQTSGGSQRTFGYKHARRTEARRGAISKSHRVDSYWRNIYGTRCK